MAFEPLRIVDPWPRRGDTPWYRRDLRVCDWKGVGVLLPEEPAPLLFALLVNYMFDTNSLSTLHLTTASREVDFREATDRLLAGGVTLDEIADACSVSKNLIARARMEGNGSRTPPPGWAKPLARLARKREAALGDLAEQLETEA